MMAGPNEHNICFIKLNACADLEASHFNYFECVHYKLHVLDVIIYNFPLPDVLINGSLAHFCFVMLLGNCRSLNGKI